MKKLSLILISLSFVFFYASISIAQVVSSDVTGKMQTYTEQVGTSAGLGNATVGGIIATIIQAGLGLLAAIFLVLMIYAGFQWMTAGGNETQIKKALDTIKTAIIGLIIVLAAYAITYFICTALPFSGSTYTGGAQGGGSSVN